MSTFWVLFFVSTGAYNGGTVATYNGFHFTAKPACEQVIQQLYEHEYGTFGLSGITTAMCIEIDYDTGVIVR